MHAATRIALFVSLTPALLPACVVDTKLVGNTAEAADTADTADEAADTDTTGVVEDTDIGATSTATATFTTADPGGDETTGAPVDPMCTGFGAYQWFMISNADGTWLTPVDETCTVLASEFVGDHGALELRLDCPLHASAHGELELVLDTGPQPTVVPQADDLLEVYYQPSFDGQQISTNPELLFLRSGGELLYAAMITFAGHADLAASVAPHHAPLTLDIEPGPCPLVDNPFVTEGQGGIGECEHVALAQLHIGSPDDETLVLDEYTFGEIAVGDRVYAAHTLMVRRGEVCSAGDEHSLGLAIALSTAP